MKRYDLSVHCAEQGLLVHAALGDFIRYADHAAFVERVREALEVLEFDKTSGVNLDEAIHAIDDARFKLSAALLEVCNG